MGVGLPADVIRRTQSKSHQRESRKARCEASVTEMCHQNPNFILWMPAVLHSTSRGAGLQRHLHNKTHHVNSVTELVCGQAWLDSVSSWRYKYNLIFYTSRDPQCCLVKPQINAHICQSSLWSVIIQKQLSVIQAELHSFGCRIMGCSCSTFFFFFLNLVSVKDSLTRAQVSGTFFTLSIAKA